MKPQADAIVPAERRKQLLLGIPGFADLPDALLTELASSLREEHFKPGTAVVTEGERGERLFLIEQGQAEVTTVGADAPVSLALLDRGDMFGEIALMVPNHRRQATVTAVTPLLALSLSVTGFEKALAASPEARLDVAAVADTLLTAKFLKQQGSWRR
jgi:CRP-like cAMP-binding protein